MLPWTLPLAFHPSVTRDEERDRRQPRTLGWELLLHSTQATSCRTEARPAYHLDRNQNNSCRCLPLGPGSFVFACPPCPTLRSSRATSSCIGLSARDSE